jgi:hypothetical protein
MLFQVAVVERPTEKEEEDGAVEKILVEPTTIVAKSQNAVAMKIVQEHSSKLRDADPDRVDILIRPFA